MSFINYFLILFLMINLAVTADTLPVNGTDYPNISCGKPKPKKEKDCTKYGTDSGMLCCWVSQSKDSSEGKCTLLSSKTAEDKFKIEGDKEFEDSGSDGNKYWSCGNKSFYLRADFFFVFILTVLSFLY